MQDEQLLKRITVDPGILAGKPVIQGTRLSVQLIIGLMAHGETIDSILQEYDYLTHADIQACLLFANRLLHDNLFVPLAKSA